MCWQWFRDPITIHDPRQKLDLIVLCSADTKLQLSSVSHSLNLNDEFINMCGLLMAPENAESVPVVIITADV